MNLLEQFRANKKRKKEEKSKKVQTCFKILLQCDAVFIIYLSIVRKQFIDQSKILCRWSKQMKGGADPKQSWSICE